jgi:hypothetical protein
MFWKNKNSQLFYHPLRFFFGGVVGKEKPEGGNAINNVVKLDS